VAIVGKDAYLWGQSVFEMHELAMVQPRRIEVACPRRVRRKIPDDIKVVRVPANLPVESAAGIPSQGVADAIRTCRHIVMTERLLRAVDDAERQGLIRYDEATSLREELTCPDEALDDT